MTSKTKIHLPLAQDAGLVELEPFRLSDLPAVPEDVRPLDITAEELSKRTSLRTSSYTIYVDLPGDPDEMLLVHGYTGAYDLVSKRVATYLRSLEDRRPPKPLYGDWTPEPAITGEIAKPDADTLKVLEERGYLVALSREEEEALFVKLSAHRHVGAIRRAPSYVIMPTYQCNLRCPYCFQDFMRTDPEFQHLLRTMDRAMADRMLRGMSRIDAAHGITGPVDFPRDVTFFGGEPLLAQSRPIIEYLLEKLLQRGETRITAITNATELEAYRDLLGPGKIATLQVTIDGPPEEHDRRRIYEDGSGSFERIAANVTMALELGVHVNVRLNVDRQNIHDLPVLADEFQARGWLQHDHFYCYVAAIHAANDATLPETTYNSWQLQRAMESLAEQHPRIARIGMTDDSLTNQARGIFNESSDMAPAFRTAFCGANTTMYVIDAFGDIYACWERTGDPALRMGHITEYGDVLMKRSVVEMWRQRNNVSNAVCRKCRYATSCGGGCQILAESAHGDGYSNYCDGYAKRFRASIAKAYQAHVGGTLSKVAMASPCDV